ncbi:MAG: tetratricopeptide repeat protein [Prevotella sp.]|uniref:tetratricopeptide repeat protein n=1 Tax=Prevotella sp. TaxID=59823 RepID=UPI002A2BFCC2|nr:tetratricopeptide repeat protein [Prevotella sp.]MDD7318552.1 tetratricopeptide repeat protein [Prevotellaceae bacterium]MDY4020353.1 tetratricopeptide repeat protein [Prevotella sp.]
MRKTENNNMRRLLTAVAALAVTLASALNVSCGGAETVSVKQAIGREKNVVTPQLNHNDEQRLKYFFLEAVSQQNKGNYDAAFDLLSHCLTINPNAAEVYFTIASYYSELGRDSMAMQSMERAAVLSPKNDRYIERLAISYINTGNIDKATDTYERLYTNDRGRTDVLGMLVQLYNQKKDYDKMLNTLERLEQVDGSSEQITLMKMHAYSMKGDKKAEFNALKQLADKYPNDLNYRVMMGNWLLKNGREDEALDEYDAVLEQEPDNVSAQMSMLDYYKRLGEDSLAQVTVERMLMSDKTQPADKIQLIRKVVDENERIGAGSMEVIRLFNKILAEPQTTPEMLQLYAGYLKLKEYPQDSIDAVLERVLDIAPDEAGARMQLIQSAWMRQNFDRVIDLSRQAQQYNPDEPTFYYFMAMAYNQKDDLDEALEAARRGVAAGSEQTNKDFMSDLYGLMGEIYHEKGMEKETFAAYDSCLIWNSENIGCLNNYAYYLSLTGEGLEKAEQMSRKTVKAEPANGIYLDTYAWILFMQGRYDEAKIYIEQALKNYDTPSADVMEHAGDIFWKCGEKDAAVDYWQQAVDAGGSNSILKKKLKQKKYLEK